MSQEAERVYTINLGKVLLSPNNQRAKRAINMIREFATRHMKTEQIKIDQDLSQTVWKRGIRSPPRKIRVKMAKTEEGYVLVSPYEEEKPKEVEEKQKTKPKETKPQKEQIEEQIEEKIEEQLEEKIEEKEETEIKKEILESTKEEKAKEQKQQEKKTKPQEEKLAKQKKG